MDNNILFFSQTEYPDSDISTERIGRRGRQAVDFSKFELPILPGFIIDSQISTELENKHVEENITQYIKRIEKIMGKQLDDAENPLLLKIVISPNLAVIRYPALHNFGLTDNTIEGFTKFVGEKFGYHEVCFLLNGALEIESKLAELEKRDKDAKNIAKIRKELKQVLDDFDDIDSMKSIIEKSKKLLSDHFFSDGYKQLADTLVRISRMLNLDELNDEDTALMVQPMVYGNYGKDSASGFFNTRNIVTGEKKLQGQYFEEKFNEIGSKGQDISKIDSSYLKKLEKIAETVEEQFLETRSVRFTIEKKKLWLIDQRPVVGRSTQSEIRTLLDLLEKKKVDEPYIINAIKPQQLNEILHPIIDTNSAKNVPSIKGGIPGAPGAAIGRVFFDTDTLMDAYKNAQKMNEDTRFILCMPATFAEDVKAIEISSGVLSSEGGYSAHASVVARQYGKVSLVQPNLAFKKGKVQIGDKTINEGDYITLNVPYYGEPKVFLKPIDLIEPDPKESGLLDYMDIVNKYVTDFHVRVNADTPRDANLALRFGAEGIGLCRTEHMFFHEDRINVFREMIVSDTIENRKKVLKRLKPMQKKDFYELLKIMHGKEVTIRLLDAPLHEFLPHNKDEMTRFLDYLKKGSKEKIDENAIKSQCDSLKEFNPMLGHRGCRIAVSYPEIYYMQAEAIFEAAYELKKEGIEVHPEIMIPLVMNQNELKLIVYGKKIEGKQIKGIADIEEEVRGRYNIEPIEYKIGTMIELPAAALAADEISKYAEFFSFGTNDLTQTTSGLSRDDFNSFMPDYTQFDLLERNPFEILLPQVKELIEISVRRSKVVRPGISLGLCGEHGAIPENIEFCRKTGLNYVSCSTYSVPIAKVTVAQLNMKEE